MESAIFPKGKEEEMPKLQETDSIKTSNTKIDANELTKETFTLGILSLMKNKGCFSKEKPSWSIEKEFEEEIGKYPKNNNRVLVHCAMGISRSASIVIMYLMKRFNISFDAVTIHP
jgi:protein tyrosine phosphatase